MVNGELQLPAFSTSSLSLLGIMPQNSQTPIQNLAANAARSLKLV